MRLLHSPSIDFIEGHVLLHSPLFERGYHVDVIHLSLACFLKGPGWPSSERTPCNRLYLPNYILWRLVWTIVTPGGGFTLILVALPPPPRSYCTPPSLHISVISLFVSILLSAPLSPDNLLYNGHDPYENGNTCSYRGCWVTSTMVLAI